MVSILLQVRTQKMPYLTNAEENELKRLEKTTDEGFFCGEALRAAKGRKSSSFGYWGREGGGGMRIQIGNFLKLK